MVTGVGRNKKKITEKGLAGGWPKQLVRGKQGGKSGVVVVGHGRIG